MRTNDANGNPLLSLTGSLVLGFDFASNSAVANVRIISGRILLLNETDGLWYTLRLKNENTIPSLFVDDAGSDL